jgi:hypothetical protein
MNLKLSVINVTPRYFENTSLLNQISYSKRIELTQHPKKHTNPFVCKIFYQSIIKRKRF